MYLSSVFHLIILLGATSPFGWVPTPHPQFPSQACDQLPDPARFLSLVFFRSCPLLSVSTILALIHTSVPLWSIATAPNIDPLTNPFSAEHTRVLHQKQCHCLTPLLQIL